MRRLLLLMPLALLAAPSAGHDAQTQCAEVKAKIRHVQSKMRQGYTRAQGERLEAELRRLRERRARVCRR